MCLIPMFVRWALFVLPAAGLFIVVGCDASGGKPRAGAPAQTECRFRFEPTEASQHAVFLIALWTGGGGYPVFVGPDAKRPLQYNETDICITNAFEEIHRRLGRSTTHNGERRILVEAKVRLEPATVEMSTLKPTYRNVYAVVIEELIRAEWYAPEGTRSISPTR